MNGRFSNTLLDPGRLLLALQRRSETRQIARWLDRCGSRGRGVVVEAPCTISRPQNLRFGDDVVIKPGAFLQARGGITFGSHCIVAPRVTILSSTHEYEAVDVLPYGTAFRDRPVTIGDHVWIGMQAIILPGAAIGEGVVVGAGAVVSGEVPPLAIVQGNPARVIRCRDADSFEKAKARGWYLNDIRGGPERAGYQTRRAAQRLLPRLRPILEQKGAIGHADLVPLGVPEPYRPALLYHAALLLDARFEWAEGGEFRVVKE